MATGGARGRSASEMGGNRATIGRCSPPLSALLSPCRTLRWIFVAAGSAFVATREAVHNVVLRVIKSRVCRDLMACRELNYEFGWLCCEYIIATLGASGDVTSNLPRFLHRRPSVRYFALIAQVARVVDDASGECLRSRSCARSGDRAVRSLYWTVPPSPPRVSAACSLGLGRARFKQRIVCRHPASRRPRSPLLGCARRGLPTSAKVRLWQMA